MVRYQLKTKREAVDYALRRVAGQPMTRDEALAMFGSMPDFSVPHDQAEPLSDPLGHDAPPR